MRSHKPYVNTIIISNILSSLYRCHFKNLFKKIVINNIYVNLGNKQTRKYLIFTFWSGDGGLKITLYFLEYNDVKRM